MRVKRLAASVLGVLLAIGVLGACDDSNDGDDGDIGTDTTLQMITTTTLP